MYWKIDKSGCLVTLKKVDQICIQIRYNFYLEPIDFNYESRLVDLYKLKDSYTEEDKVDPKIKYEKTGQKRLNPLHSHIIKLPIDVSESLIENIGNQLLQIVIDYNSKGYFDNGEYIYIPNTLPNYEQFSEENKIKAEEKLKTILDKKSWLL